MTQIMRKYIYISIFAFLFQLNSANAGSTGSEELKSNGSQSGTSECFEGISRAMFSLNHGLDKAIFKPIAKGYRALPVPIRKGTGNVVDNLRSLLTFSNNILQGDFSKAGNTAGRFAINTTVGILGIWDPASALGLEKNGKEVQKGNSKNMIFSFDKIISYISKFCTIKIGDLIYTGTPKGVGSIEQGDDLIGFIGKQEMLKVKIK